LSLLQTARPKKNFKEKLKFGRFCSLYDGASNMISFSDLLLSQKFILPNLCAAHGFSLVVHYIGKVFDDETNMFSKVSGIIAFFNRSSHRTALLREYEKQTIGFIKFCKTRMAYQTLCLLRVLRLRSSAQKAMIELLKERTTGKGSKETEEGLEPFSKLDEVDAALKDDKLFKLIEVFCRATFPVLIAMREVDKGVPMAGFVYWLFYHVESQVDQIMEALEKVDSSFVETRSQISSVSDIDLFLP